jgi:hypothetical protein
MIMKRYFALNAKVKKLKEYIRENFMARVETAREAVPAVVDAIK